jgi:hypothetical protein
MSVLGQYELQFGLFRGKTFKWLVENGLGYGGWIVDDMRSESATTAPLSKNKHAFKRYINSFPEGQSVVNLKKEERLKKAASTSSQSKIFANYIYLLGLKNTVHCSIYCKSLFISTHIYIYIYIC